MIVEPKIRNNICLTAHPVGCARQVRNQIGYVQGLGPLPGPRNALVIGSSNGYGLAARIVACFGSGAKTVGVACERPGGGKRPGSAGWYNDRAFLAESREAGLGAWSVNGDAFSDEVKSDTLRQIADGIGPVKLVIYSIASPRRRDPRTGELHSSAIKPTSGACRAKTVDIVTGNVTEVEVQPATAQEIDGTVKVMGGEDWSLWIDALQKEDLLARDAVTVAFSYIGPQITDPIYRDGTIGRAKQHLESTARQLNERLAPAGGRAIVSVNKALVTRASAVIPAVPLYISLLYRVMKHKGLHEGCIQQMYRLFRDHLFAVDPRLPDEQGRIRLDDWEMREDVQCEVAELWEKINSENVERLSDIQGFRDEFLRHHGFGMPGVDYTRDVQL